MIKVFLSGFLIISFVIGLAAQGVNSLPRNDNQFWNETQVFVLTSKRHDIAVNGFFRAGRNFTHPSDERIGMSYGFKPTKYTTFTAGYLYRAAQPRENVKSYESRYIAAVTLHIPLWNKFKIHDRNQFEYKRRNAAPNTRDYRNRFRLEREVTINKTKVMPFGFVELFYNERDRWYRSRVALGVGKKLTEKITGEVFYLRQNDGRNFPGDFHVLGTYLRINL